MNKDPLNHLERLLKGSPNANGCDGADDDAAADENIHECLHGKLFGDRDSVTQLLKDERKFEQKPFLSCISRFLGKLFNILILIDVS